MSDPSAPLRFNASRVLARSCESLLGICQGLLADSTINERELLYLDTWLRQNKEISSVWPGSVIAARAGSILVDGLVTEEELDQLKEVLESLIGGRLEETGAVGGLATRLPVDADAIIKFNQHSFCFTGKFLFGTRVACESAVIERGGRAVSSPARSLNYLVIGTLISPDWMYSTHGRKIEQGVAYQQDGANLLIVTEDQWIAALNVCD